jgi:hypothetical protein
LSIVEEKIKKILAATGVDVPSLAAGFFLLELQVPDAFIIIIASSQKHYINIT